MPLFHPNPHHHFDKGKLMWANRVKIRGPERVKPYNNIPPWLRTFFPHINISSKSSMTNCELKTITEMEVNHLYPSQRWIRVYTDGSAKDVTKDGGGGIYIELPSGEKIEQATPTGSYSSNYRAEADAILEACTILSNHNQIKDHRVVFLTDARSVLQALDNPRDTQFTDLINKLNQIGNLARQAALQWIPGHCGINGNDIADKLARNASDMLQVNHGLSHQETRAIVKSSIHQTW